MAAVGLLSASGGGVRLHVVGGLGAFGMNCMVLEDMASGQAVVVDAGVGFPRELPASRERLLADPNFLRAFEGRLLAYVLTHGHEDHIGATGLFHHQLPAPVYGTPTTLALVEARCKDMGVALPPLHPLEAGADITLGPIHLTALAVNHSIPDSLCLVFTVGGLTVVHSGDFRLETHPVLGVPTDMPSLEALGARGVDLLLADSTGALVPGHNPGEATVAANIRKVVDEAPARVFVTTFASHVQRAHVVAQAAAATGRRIMLGGRGMLTHTRLAQRLGGLDGLDALGVHASEACNLPPRQLAVLLSGCQGEEHSAFWRLAHADARLPPVQRGDVVLHAARAVPGAEGRLAHLMDQLAERGARVVDGASGVHVSGHGYRDDMAALMAAVQPRAVIPIHGGTRHLVAMADLARSLGVDEARSPVVRSGDVVELKHGGVPTVVDHMPVPSMMVDDDGQLCLADPVADERRALHGGLVVVTATVDPATGALLGRPRVTARGLSGTARQLVLSEGAHEAAVSVYALCGDELADGECVEHALRKGIRRVLRRAHWGRVSVISHAHTPEGEPLVPETPAAHEEDAPA